MTGNRTIKEKETEKKRGRKRFIERLVEEKDAETLIKEYLNNENSTNEGGTDRQDGDRSISR